MADEEVVATTPVADTPDPKSEVADHSVALTAEQQKAVDRAIGERLKRERTKWQEELEKRTKETAGEAELKRLEEEQKWQELATRNQGKASEAAATAAELDRKLQNAEAVISRILSTRLLGLPSSVTDLLSGREPADQLAIVEAFLASRETEPTPQGPSASTPASPRPQGTRGLTAEERRSKASRTW